MSRRQKSVTMLKRLQDEVDKQVTQYVNKIVPPDPCTSEWINEIEPVLMDCAKEGQTEHYMHFFSPNLAYTRFNFLVGVMYGNQFSPCHDRSEERRVGKECRL